MTIARVKPQCAHPKLLASRYTRELVTAQLHDQSAAWNLNALRPPRAALSSPPDPRRFTPFLTQS
jgi:hypothetical protein